LKPDRLPRRASGTARPPKRTNGDFVRSLEQRPKRLHRNGVPTIPQSGTVRSFNFSRLARSTCCQRPRHLTPERGDSVGAGRACILETPSTHLNGMCRETLQPYRDSRFPSTRALNHSGAGIKTGTAVLPRPFWAERTRDKLPGAVLPF